MHTNDNLLINKCNYFLPIKDKLIYITQKRSNIPSTSEWQNSIYKFNKNVSFEASIKDKLSSNIIKSYFSSKPKYLYINNNCGEHITLNRIFTTLTFKHTINELFISIYSFNKEKLYLLNKLNRWTSNKYLQKCNHWYKHFVLQNIKFKNTTLKYKNKFRFIKFKFLYNKFKNSNVLNLLIKGLITINIFKKFQQKALIHFMINFFSLHKNISSIYVDGIIHNLSLYIFKNKYKKIYIYRNYVIMLYINNIKFNVNNIISMLNILNNIYNKKINVNIIKLKYLYLDNFLLTDAVVRKLNDRNKRVLKVLRKAVRLIKKANINKFLYKLNIRKEDLYYNIKINTMMSLDSKYNVIINNIDNKYLIGLKLQGNGRLTKRLTASRSILKSDYVGKLKDFASSVQRKTTILIKGFISSSIKYLNINSYNRNGSFSVKGWSNTY